MLNPLYKRYAAKKPVGAAYISNTFGMHVYEPEEADKIAGPFETYVCSWHNGEHEWGFHRHIVHFSTAGRPFIRKGSMRIYFDNIMRV